MTTSSISDLLVEQLRELYDAEMQLIRALPEFARAADEGELAVCFRKHLEDARRHAARLERLFEMLGAAPDRKACMAMRSLVQEGLDVTVEEFRKPFLDIALIAVGRQFDLYQLGSFEALATMAQAAEHTDMNRSLQEMMAEKMESDRSLAAIAKRLMKEVAIRSAERDPEDDRNPTPAAAVDGVEKRTSARAAAASYRR